MASICAALAIRLRSSTGCGNATGLPRRVYKDICWREVNMRRASVSRSATTTLAATITYGRSNWREDLKRARQRWSAAFQAPGAKCHADAKGQPSMAATEAPDTLEPRIQTGAFSAAP